MTDKMDRYQKCAGKIAQWMVANQVQDDNDANNGRLPGLYTPEEGEGSLSYSINWTSGASLKGLLMMMSAHIEDKIFYQSALRIGEYLKTLQITGQFAGKHEGAFREITPQTNWCFPRDGLTAAWALLRLYQITREKEYLQRVKLFNEWFFRVAFTGNWPLWKVNFSGKQDLPDSLHGSFHGGTAAYFWDYYRVTGDSKWMDKGVKQILEYLLKYFLQENGEFKIIRDSKNNYYLDGKDSDNYPVFWQRMHRYNDDFSSQGLLGGYLYYKESRYLQKAEQFAGWLLSKQNEDGSFGKPFVPSASATSILLFLDLYDLTGKKKYYKAALAAASHIVFLQDKDVSCHRSYGGIYGESGRIEHPRKVINLRVTSYALIALLRLTKESGLKCYSAVSD